MQEELNSLQDVKDFTLLRSTVTGVAFDDETFQFEKHIYN